jgi:hypothetical protein
MKTLIPIHDDYDSQSYVVCDRCSSATVLTVMKMFLAFVR